jgi:putative flippase GtrA
VKARDTWKTTGLRWLKFNFVGALGIVVQLLILALLVTGLRLHYLVATGVAVEIAVLHNFYWHERYTWLDRTCSRPGEVLRRLVRFNCSTGAISIFGNLILMRLLVGQAHLQYLIANLVTVAACAVLNFLMSDWFVFQRR